MVDEADHGYVFRHTLTRDAIYSDTLPRRRVRIHAAYAGALSADPGLAGRGAHANVATALALHWSAAHDLPRALPTCLEAARLAAPYAPAEALRQLERALELWPRVPDAEARCGVDVVELLRLAGLNAYAAGAVDRSLSLYDEALDELGPQADPERRALLLEARAAALIDIGRPDIATTALEEAASLLPEEPQTLARGRAVIAGHPQAAGGGLRAVPPRGRARRRRGPGGGRERTRGVLADHARRSARLPR